MLKTSLHFARKGLGHAIRIALVGALLAALAFWALLLGMRYWILPDIERYRGIITVSASEAIGQPVTIGKIEADLRGARLHLSLSDVHILDKRGQTALILPRVDNVVSWTSLLAGEVRMHSLELEHPDLLVSRDAQGSLYIAGMALSGESSDTSLADWLLHQERIAVHDARITWLDEQRSAPPLVFNKVNFLIENSGFLGGDWFAGKSIIYAISKRHHRFAMHALPPAGLAVEVDVRGDFYGNSFSKLQNWSGQLFTQLDYVDAGAWRTWLPLPSGFRLGKGALRGWLDIEEGKAKHLTADLALADVQAQLGDALPLLDLKAMHGRLSWQESAQGMEISAKNFSLQMHDGLRVEPTDFFLRLAAKGVQDAENEMRASSLDFGSLMGLADYLPLGEGIKKQLFEFTPQGRVNGLQAQWLHEEGKPLQFNIKTQFNKLSLQRTGKFPGFSGLSGEMTASEHGGTLSLKTHNLTVDAPGIMPEQLQFDSLSAQSSWQLAKGGLEVRFSNVSVANADVAGNIFGSFHMLLDGSGAPRKPGAIDLTINLSRAAVNHAYRYIPLAALSNKTHNWIRDALLDGQASEFRLRLLGDLKDFPYSGDRKGVFSIRMRAKDVALKYAKEWPQIDNIAADLLVQGNHLEVIAQSGITQGAHLQQVSVSIPDLISPDMQLQIHGEALTETAQGLDFIQESPVRRYIGGFTDSMSARGSGKLVLQADIPLKGDRAAKVSGLYHFADNEINAGKSVPLLSQLNGDLLFTESSMHTRNMAAQILGGPATLSVQSGADGAVEARAKGRADIEVLRQSTSHPLLSYLGGSSEWEAVIQIQKKQADITVTSDLAGMESRLPEPFNKTATEAVPLRFERKSVGAQQDMLSLQYGNLLEARLLRQEEEGEWVAKRGAVSFGGQPMLMSREGVWIGGTVPKLELGGWGGLLNAFGGGTPIGIAGADLIVRSLDVYGYKINDLHVNAINRDNALVAQLASREANGEVAWEGQGKGRFHARLKNLTLVKDGSSKKESPVQKPVEAEVIDKNETSVEFPALDLEVGDLNYKGMLLGRVELLAQHHGQDWILEHMRLINPDGLMTATGKWGVAGDKMQTQINLKLEIADAGRILARSGYPDSVKKGSGKFEAELSWKGRPDDFSYTTLDGILKLDTGKGQFLKIKPGIGKLLGILSLQALPQHITLDFTDVFSDGFAFDSITGTAQVSQGMLSTSDFRISGSAAKITMAGQIDLDRETQNLNIRILPTVGNSVSMLGAVTGGPLIGLGTFIINKLLREPLDKLVSFEYNVTGTWEQPNVVRLGAKKADPPGNN